MKALALLLVAASIAGVGQANAQTPVERGRYLVEAVMSCHNCHTPQGPEGPDFSRALSGGETFDEPAFKVTASNITPDKTTGIGSWSDDELKSFLVTGMRPNGVPTAPIMPTMAGSASQSPAGISDSARWRRAAGISRAHPGIFPRPRPPCSRNRRW